MILILTTREILAGWRWVYWCGPWLQK